MLRTETKDHLKAFQAEETIKEAAMSGDTTKLQACLSHGFNINKPLASLYGFSKHALISSPPCGNRN